MSVDTLARVLYDADSNPVGVIQDGVFYRLQVQVAGDVGTVLPKLSGDLEHPTAQVTSQDGSLTVDAKNRLVARAQVSTVRGGSYRDDFNSDLEANLTGTVTFEAGTTVTGSGTAFLTELTTDSFIRLSTDTGVKAQRVLTLVSDTEVELEAAYTGATTPGTATKSAWRLWPGTGMTISRAGTLLTVDSGTTVGFSHVIRSFGDGPGVFAAHARITSRLLGQTAALGFRDPAGNAEAVVIFDGTDAKIAKFRTGQGVGDVQETRYKFPTGNASLSDHYYRIEMYPTSVQLWIDDQLVAEHHMHLPSLHDEVWAGAYFSNDAAPTTSSQLILDSMSLERKELLEARLSPVFESLRIDPDGNLKVALGSFPLALQSEGPNKYLAVRDTRVAMLLEEILEVQKELLEIQKCFEQE